MADARARPRFSSSPRAEQQIRDLAGADQVSIYLAGDNTSKWASLSGKAVLPTTAHVATGAAILGLCWLTTLRARRLLRVPAAKAAVRVPLADPALS